MRAVVFLVGCIATAAIFISLSVSYTHTFTLTRIQNEQVKFKHLGHINHNLRVAHDELEQELLRTSKLVKQTKVEKYQLDEPALDRCARIHWPKSSPDFWKVLDDWCWTDHVVRGSQGVITTFAGNRERHRKAVLQFMRQLRKFSNVSVEIFYAGVQESPPLSLSAELESFGSVKILDLYQALRRNTSPRHRCMPTNGYHFRDSLVLTNFKILALYASSFENLMFADVNVIFFHPPEAIFGLRRSSSVYLFRDYNPGVQEYQAKNAWDVFGVRDAFKSLGPDTIDSSIILIDKTEAKKVVCGAFDYALLDFIHDPFFFGDKDVWWFVCLATKSKCAVHSVAPGFLIEQAHRPVDEVVESVEEEDDIGEDLQLLVPNPEEVFPTYESVRKPITFPVSGHLQIAPWSMTPLYLNFQDPLRGANCSNVVYYDGSRGSFYPHHNPVELPLKLLTHDLVDYLVEDEVIQCASE